MWAPLAVKPKAVAAAGLATAVGSVSFVDLVTVGQMLIALAGVVIAWQSLRRRKHDDD